MRRGHFRMKMILRRRETRRMRRERKNRRRRHFCGEFRGRGILGVYNYMGSTIRVNLGDARGKVVEYMG